MASIERTFILLGRHVTDRKDRNNQLCLELGQMTVNM